ncbi:hypothetical protein [Proteiniborus sp. MB09-C3]|uniref:GNAT family N-acetyltransferase n=1 Tax=Proteiniborus sp. MB09-C3 TaxID=3050072 RepID=UPI002554DF67|nr:hypothetical protein [Proteiniborus sp. MB09-C3]WIV13372.1 hypothetical protein QO263_06605 [Proteiniborus sp. MB09-C3]
MKDSEILILDEYTSALDSITIGKNIVQYAEKEMLEKGADSFYVTVYNPAKIFWENCGYVNTEKIAFNGLQIYKKAK